MTRHCDALGLAHILITLLALQEVDDITCTAIRVFGSIEAPIIGRGEYFVFEGHGFATFAAWGAAFRRPAWGIFQNYECLVPGEHPIWKSTSKIVLEIRLLG